MKQIQNFVVMVRHGGDTRQMTEIMLVGAKSPDEAVEIARDNHVKHYHYSCHFAQFKPKTTLKHREIVFKTAPERRGNRLSYHPQKRRS